MPQTNAKKFQWTKKRTLAARLVAEGELTDVDIAQKAGVHVATLWRWEQHAEFQLRINEHRDAYAELVKQEGITNRQNRIDELNALWGALRSGWRERAEEYAGQADVPPGAGNGLWTVRPEMIGQGPRQERVELWEYASAEVRDNMALMQQAAKELGQWLEKSESRLTIDIESTLQQMADEYGVPIDQVRETFTQEAKRAGAVA